MNGKWMCLKCHSWNEEDKTRCSFCSAAKPFELKKEESQTATDDKLKQHLHNIVETLSPLQKTKLMRYFEDNVL